MPRDQGWPLSCKASLQLGKIHTVGVGVRAGLLTSECIAWREDVQGFLFGFVLESACPQEQH